MNCSGGLNLAWKEGEISLTGNDYNKEDGYSGTAYYDLLYSGDKIDGNGRIIVRLAGNVIKEVIDTIKEEKIPIIPVGLTLAFNPEKLPNGLKEGVKLTLSVPGYEDVLHAVEAGPLLLENGEEAIDMKTEGWKTVNSIRTQAARL